MTSPLLLSITERSAFAIVNDLTRAGYVVKAKDGRRNRYEVQGHLPVPDPISRSATIGEVLALLTGHSGRSIAGRSPGSLTTMRSARPRRPAKRRRPGSVTGAGPPRVRAPGATSRKIC